MVGAQKSDLFDVLAYIAYALPTVTRKERVENHQEGIFKLYNDKQQQFLAFVLDHYITQGVGELDQDKLPNLLELKYHSMGDAVTELGSVPEIRNVFVGFQEHLYRSQDAA
jgi:type I restriction enzyme, R subunit